MGRASRLGSAIEKLPQNRLSSRGRAMLWLGKEDRRLHIRHDSISRLTPPGRNGPTAAAIAS
jgi:hypothetical protein